MHTNNLMENSKLLKAIIKYSLQLCSTEDGGGGGESQAKDNCLMVLSQMSTSQW